MKKFIAMLLVVILLATMLCSAALAAISIRSGPGTNYRRKFSLSGGTTVRVISQKRTSAGYLWLKIKCKKGTGWVQAKYVNGYKSKWYKKPSSKRK